jgi:hypothetical protein
MPRIAPSRRATSTGHRLTATLVAAILLGSGGCDAKRRTWPKNDAGAGLTTLSPVPSPDAAPPPSDTELRGADGRLALTLHPQGGGLEAIAPGDVRFTLVRADDGWDVHDGTGALVLRRRPAPNGDHVTDPSGALRFRVVTGTAEQLDLIGPDGVALIRTRPATDGVGAVARDAGGRPLHTCRPEGGRLVIAAADGTHLATVHQLADAQRALILHFDALPLAERLAALAPAPTAGAAVPQGR